MNVAYVASLAAQRSGNSAAHERMMHKAPDKASTREQAGEGQDDDHPGRAFQKNITAMYDAGAGGFADTWRLCAPVEVEAAQEAACAVDPNLAVEHDQATQLPNLITNRTPGASQPAVGIEPDVAVTQVHQGPARTLRLSEGAPPR